MSKFAGKKAIVVGGTSGIGLSTSRQLRDGGAQVVAISRRGSLDDSDNGDNSNIAVESCDILDRDGLAALFAKHAPYDYLVGAATGGARARGPFLEMDMDEYAGSFAKLWGYTNTVRYGTEHLTADGAIVLVSGSPARKCSPGMIAISSVGNAVEGFARGIAPELAPRRINVVSPGLIDTPMSPLKGKEREDFYKNATAENLIPRAGLPDEIAEGILLCLSNTFMTGAVIDVDGGILLP